MVFERPLGDGWLALVGGGEFTFGETRDADRGWVEKLPPGALGFLPVASGSTEYCEHFTTYVADELDREVKVVPIYRRRDAKRAKNLERIDAVSGVYLGGGVTDFILEAMRETPAEEALRRKLAKGGAVVAIAAAAQALGMAARSLMTRDSVDGLGWLAGGVVEPNFDPGFDRRLRELMDWPGVEWGLGLPAGSAVLLGPEGEVETIGMSFVLTDAEGDLEPIT
jgi:cyanophycinase-like exopeptidase